MDPFSLDAVRTAYDTVASDYAAAFGDDLTRLPVDRDMLDAALAAAPDDGWILEVGCGPAPAATYFADRTRPLLAVDLSAAMLTTAAIRNPGLPTAQADLRQLPLRNGGCAVVIAYYTLQHLPRTALGPALAEFHRVLHDGGVLAVATHLGDGDVVSDEFLGHRVAPFAGCLYQRHELRTALTASGFSVEREVERGPLPHEYESRRLYLLARRADP